MDSRSTRALVRALLFAALLRALPAAAQGDHFADAWRWVEFTTESGLPSNDVTGLTETKDGTVWAVTTKGVAWYDGFQWHPVPNMPQERFGAILPYGSSRVVSNREGIIYVINRDSAAALPLRDVSLGAPLDSTTLIVRMEKSLFLYTDGHLRPMQGDSDRVNGSIDIFWKTRTNRLWIRTRNGLFTWDRDHWQSHLWQDAGEVSLTAIEEAGRIGGIASVILPLDMRGIWEWTDGGTPVRNREEIGYDVKAIDLNPAGDAIVVYNSSDIRIRRGGRWSSLTSVQSRLGEVEFVQWRDNGDLWFGTEHGLFLFKQSSSRWEVLAHPSPDPRNSINEILQTRGGDLWVGTADGVDVYHKGGATEQISSIGSTQLYTVTGLAEDREGNIWITSGATFDGAFRWNGREWRHFDVSDDPEGARFHKIRADRDGRLWFLGISRHYGYRGAKEVGAYVRSGDRFVRWGEDEGLTNGRVYSFTQSPDGALWFGSLDGMSRWTPAPSALHADAPTPGGHWTYWTRGKGIPYNKVFTLAADSAGRVWMGHATSGSGLGYVDANDSVHYVTSADGLLNDFVWDLRVDASGMLWVATDAGLCSFAKGIWLTYDEKTGLHYSKLWPVLPLRDEVYAGTRGKGIAILNRGESPWRTPRIVIDRPLVETRDVHFRWKAYSYWGESAPELILTRYRIGDEPWSPWGATREIVRTDLPTGEQLVQVQAKGLVGNFDPAPAVAAFAVLPPYYLRPLYYIPIAALSFGIVTLAVVLLARKRKHDLDLRKSEAKFRAVAQMSPSAIVIYQDGPFLFANPGAESLTGYTGEELHHMRLSDLVHPEYREMMDSRERDRSGESAVPNRAEFLIVTKQGAARWVDYRWGWIRYQGLPATLGTAFDITERKLAEDKLRLLTTELTLTEERERHRMATFLHDVIGQTLALCKIKIRGIQKSSIPDPWSGSLAEVRDLVDLSIRNTQSLTFDLCPPILYELSFEAAAGWLADQFHQQHGIEFAVHDDGAAKPLTEEMRAILFQALREIYVNVVKHAAASKVDVAISRCGANIRIVVRDNGAGFDAETLRHPEPDRGGFGLFNIRERLKYLGGSVEVASARGAGTCVTIDAPLKGASLTVSPQDAA